MDIPYVWGSITTHQYDTVDEQASAYFVEWLVPLEGGEQDVVEYEEVGEHNGLPVA